MLMLLIQVAMHNATTMVTPLAAAEVAEEADVEVVEGAVETRAKITKAKQRRTPTLTLRTLAATVPIQTLEVIKARMTNQQPLQQAPQWVQVPTQMQPLPQAQNTAQQQRPQQALRR